VSKTACTRCFKLERWRTRCSRQRARSRSARTSGSGSQIAGTRSRRASSASYPSVDPVGLAGQGREALDLLRIRDLDLPARQLEPIVHKACAVHRLDRGADRLAMPIESPRQAE
jgi:hypothetical protein